MGKKLVIVESPAKARTISRYLGKEYVVEACRGHVRDLPEREFGVDVEAGFEPTYRILPGSRRVISKLKRESRKAEEVYLAPDPDREGEAIAWHLVHALELPEDAVKRATFQEITREAVREAFASPRGLDMDLVNAQQARRILDRIVGYELSPLISKKIVRGLSAGRVQSVALRLVVDREREVEAFEPEEYWRITATFACKEGELEAELKELDGEEVCIRQQEEAEAAVARLSGEKFRIASVSRKKARSRPSAPFITSTLQQVASSRLGMSTSQVMRVAQELYEGVEVAGQNEGLITYMRTDSTRVSKRALASVRDYIRDEFGGDYLPNRPNSFKGRKGAQEAHEAIRPTDVRRTPDSVKPYLSRRQWQLYDLIWRRFVASQMTAAVYDVTKLTIESESGLFEASGRQMVFPGYTRVAGQEKGSEERRLPGVTEGEEMELRALVPSQHFTQPPPRYTEATLVREMERRGIGRPSTYAPTIATLLRRNYLRRRRRTLYPTDLGRVVVSKLVRHFPREVEYSFTRDLEAKLDKIEEGEVGWRETLQDFYSRFSRDLKRAMEEMTAIEEELPEGQTTCPECGKRLVARFSRQGDRFLGCQGFPECTYTLSLEGEKGEETEHKCPDCGATMLKRISRRGNPYLTCSNYPSCKRVMALDGEGNPVEMRQRSPLGHNCPRCGGRLYVEDGEGGPSIVCDRCSRKQPLLTLEQALRETGELPLEEVAPCEKCGGAMSLRRGRKGYFLGCVNYPSCKNARPLETGVLPDPVPTRERCEKCGRPLLLRWGRYGRFLACSGFPACRNTWQFSSRLPACPREGCDGHIVKKISADGEEFYGCTRWPECDYTTAERPKRAQKKERGT